MRGAAVYLCKEMRACKILILIPLPWGEGGPRRALSPAGAGRVRGYFVRGFDCALLASLSYVAGVAGVLSRLILRSRPPKGLASAAKALPSLTRVSGRPVPLWIRGNGSGSKSKIGNRKSKKSKSPIRNRQSTILKYLEPFLVHVGIAFDDDVLLGKRFEFAQQPAFA